MKCKKTKNHDDNNEHTEFQAMAVELLRFLNCGSVLKKNSIQSYTFYQSFESPFLQLAA